MKPTNLDRLPLTAEVLLSELAEADRAGVFRPSPVDIDSLTNRGVRATRPRFSRIAKGWTAAAAAFLLLATAWSMMFYREFGEMRYRVTNSAAQAKAAQSAEFFACVSGPAGGLTSECVAYDLDSDGRIDLSDYRAFQLGL